MDEKALKEHLRTLYPKEDEDCEWKEFKNLKNCWNSRKGDDVESYVSAIANMEGGHLVLGVKDKTLDIVGIQDFGDYNVVNVRYRLAGRCFGLNTESLKVASHVIDDTKKTVWVIHVPKHSVRQPVYAHGVPWQRVGDSLVQMRQERLDAILSEKIEGTDWTAVVVDDARIADLDEAALVAGREKFKKKNENEPWYDQIDSWDWATFLDKAKVTANGTITRAAILIFGTSNAAYFLSPHSAQITWKLDAEEKAYQHFWPPWLLTTSDVFKRVRNIPQKLFPSNQLQPIEIQKYETRTILEALHNCLAHQDYERSERVLVTEKADRLIFENAGAFFEGEVDDYLAGKRTPKRYRNPWGSLRQWPKWE